MSKDPSNVTITAVIPTYNSGHIEACLKSILSQTEEKLREVIVVDDASTDNTVEKVLRLKLNNSAQRVTLLRLERNSGPSEAKNAGIRKASGTYIACIDSDMVLQRDCIAHLAADLQASGSAGAMAYFMVPREVSPLTRVIGYDLEYRLSRILKGRRWMEVGKLGTGMTLFVKSTLVEAGLFDTDRRVGEDTVLSYRMREMGRRLIVSSGARCIHYWQSRGLKSYVWQQVGYGQGILQAYFDTRRIPHDPVSSPLLRVNALLAACSVVALVILPFVRWTLWIGVIAILAQLVNNTPPTLWILRRRRDIQAGTIAPFVFLVRNYSWAVSLAVIVPKIAASLRHN